MTAVWIDGGLVPEDAALVPYDDHGITVGDGVFETVRVRDGCPFALGPHLERLRRSLSAMRIPEPAGVEQAVDAVSAAAGGDGFLRITVTAGRGPLASPRDEVRPRLIVAVRPGDIRVEPTHVVTAPWPRNERGALAGVKSTSYGENVVALAVAAESGASEALFANTRGELCEGTGSNVFVVLDGVLCTPPRSAGCLAGVTRALLIELLAGEVVERPIPMSHVPRATEAFLASTSREVQPIARWDERELPAPGPLTQRARAAWVAAYG